MSRSAVLLVLLVLRHLSRAAPLDAPLLILRQHWVPAVDAAAGNSTQRRPPAVFNVASFHPAAANGTAVASPAAAECEAPQLNITQLPQALQERLACVAGSGQASGADEEWWRLLWLRGGACLEGWDAPTYFQALTEVFQQFDANRALAPGNLTYGQSALLETLQSEWGAAPGLVCQEQSGQGPSVLWQLVMCLNRTTLEPVACPPGARGGLPACSSEQLQLLPGYPMAPACSQHVPKTLRHVTLEQPGGLADCLNATGGGGCGLAPATGAPVDAPEAPPADASWLRTCYAYFTRLDANLTACTNSLEWASEQLIVSAGWNPALNPDTVFTAADCTPVCAGIFADLPPDCADALEALRPAGYYSGLPLSRTYDLCKTLACPVNQHCSISGQVSGSATALLALVDGAVWAWRVVQNADLHPVGSAGTAPADPLLARCQAAFNGTRPRMARCLAAVERANTSPVTKGADGLWHYAEPVVTAAQCPRECTGVFKGVPGECSDWLQRSFCGSLYFGPPTTPDLNLCTDVLCPSGLCNQTDKAIQSTSLLWLITDPDWWLRAASLAESSASNPSTCPLAGDAAATSQASQASSSGNSGGGISAGAIAGIAVGVAVGAAALALAGFALWRRHRKQQVAAAQGKAASSDKTSALESGETGSSAPLFPPPLGSISFHLPPRQPGAGSADVAGNGSALASPTNSSQPGSEAGDDLFLRAVKSGQLHLAPAGPAAEEDPALPSLDPAAAMAAAFPRPSPFAAPAPAPGTPPGERSNAGAATGAGANGSQQHSGSRSGMAAGSSLSSQPTDIWAIPFQELTLHRRIGQGAFGRVYLATWHQTPCAVKVLLARPVLDEPGGLAGALAAASPLVARLQGEARLMFALRHPNCVQLMGTCTTPPCLVTEYCARGSLRDCLTAARNDPRKAARLTWHLRLSIALDAAKGMLYLHTRTPPMLNRDLKSPNLLLSASWDCKARAHCVADFGLSKLLGQEQAAGSSAEVTNPRWLAPEVLQGQPASLAADVFAFGTVLHELISWEIPFATWNPWQIAKAVAAGYRPPVPPRDRQPGADRLPPDIEGGFLRLMGACWAQDPGARPSFEQAAAALRDLLQRLEAQLPLEAAGSAAVRRARHEA